MEGAIDGHMTYRSIRFQTTLIIEVIQICKRFYGLLCKHYCIIHIVSIRCVYLIRQTIAEEKSALMKLSV